ncbi:MAG: hypothetical protein IJI73_04755 [Kiritimatiellae bacterium]|nr:hypothetical protein [Kiritimatiellia bacterium]
MNRIIFASLLILGLFAAAGCRTDDSGLCHRGCHKVGVRRAGRSGNSVTHHHYAKPGTPAGKDAE